VFYTVSQKNMPPNHGRLIFAFASVPFLKIYISQSSAATHLTCGGIFNDSFIANFLQSVQ